ncbi:MAG: VCBS repeat-containing protein, partial [Cyclobacteriaceae bacterium]
MIHCFLQKQGYCLLKLTLFLSFVFFVQIAQAQTVDCSINTNCSDGYCQFAANVEKGCNCFDNIDNDADGKVDKADSNCATYYGLVFVGADSDCSIVPPGANTPFDLVNAPITSAQNTADTQSKVSVGDVDGDGIPDAVITSKWNSEIRVVATASGQADGTAAGQVKSDFKTTGAGAAIFSGTGGCDPKNLLFEHENLIADIDKDGKAELFGVVSNRAGNPSSPPTCFFLVGLRYAPASLVPLYNAVNLGSNRPGTFGIADMDGDGKAEIYLRDRIYAAETGKLLATANGNWDLDVTSGPVAVNINGDNKMELVCGTKIYSIPSLTNRNPATPAALTLVADMNAITTNDAYVKLAIDPVEYGTDTHSMCSVADIDRDGNMDVVISGALNAVNGPTAVFYWNVAKGTVSYYIATDPAYANGWPWGTGRVNLGDANGDGRTDLSFIAGARLHCLTTDAAGNLVSLWAGPRIINDSRSGVLTLSIYDFNNDGDPEMVYRDSQELAVIDGATGTIKIWSAVCQSHTYTEGPVIADVNGDGGTDICVPCNTNNSFNINAGIQQQALGQFRLYYSSGNEWLPTRKVWNQPGYFVVNINDDLTLPFPQLDQNLIFGTADCLNGLPGPQMPMNVFLNQVPYLSAGGCPVYPAPDLAYFGDNPDSPGVD